ncbi:MAG TPA: F0F1 ATP synthase subunit A, partial [Cytophagaceae bacterium]
MGQLTRFLKKYSLLAFLFVSQVAFCQEHTIEEGIEEEESFNAGELITHHIGDAHEWHFATVGHHHYSIPLPIILYSDRGLEIFSSSKLSHGEDHLGYQLDKHGNLQTTELGRYIYGLAHKGEGSPVYDLSITKNVASLFISALLLLTIFISIAASYKKNKGKAPKGIQSFFEPIIMFVRDDIARPSIGPRYERFLPYLLTIFFFIWFNNLLGLIPGGANLTGNIAVTLFLALLTFIITNVSGNKTYWGHVFNTPGVPLPLRPLMIVLEFIGLFTKPFSLMVRLFANITAGHIIILSFLGLI